MPVLIENDGNAAAVAEHRLGAAREARHAIMLTLGTGVGGGLILDDRLYRGAVGAAGELGHITLDLDGPPCQGACPGGATSRRWRPASPRTELAERAALERTATSARRGGRTRSTLACWWSSPRLAPATRDVSSTSASTSASASRIS